VNRLFAAWLVAALVVAACGPSAHWVGEEIDGFIVGGERPCAIPPADDCAPQLAAALAQLTPEERTAVSAAAIGGEPARYVEDNGQPVLTTQAGLTRGYGVILDIAGQPRRVIPLVCGRLAPVAGEPQVNYSCEYSPYSLPRAD
jgi:hypothetical protein